MNHIARLVVLTEGAQANVARNEALHTKQSMSPTRVGEHGKRVTKSVFPSALF